MKLLKDLGASECKYPIEEDRSQTGHFYFCAAATGNPLVNYCTKHGKIVSQPARSPKTKGYAYDC